MAADNMHVDPVVQDSRVPIGAHPESVSAYAVTDRPSMLAAYGEVCRSYHAIDDYRMKLLGFLPLASIVGLVVLEKGELGAVSSSSANEIVAYASFFAAAFTLALFIYEIRGIRRSHHLVCRGEDLEQRLGVRGQFWVCTEDARAATQSNTFARRVARMFNSTAAACTIYSLVFAAWLFVALRYGLAFDALTCGLCAIGFGGLVAAGAYRVVRKLIPA